MLLHLHHTHTHWSIAVTAVLFVHDNVLNSYDFQFRVYLWFYVRCITAIYKLYVRMYLYVFVSKHYERELCEKTRKKNTHIRRVRTATDNRRTRVKSTKVKWVLTESERCVSEYVCVFVCVSVRWCWCCDETTRWLAVTAKCEGYF